MLLILCYCILYLCSTKRFHKVHSVALPRIRDRGIHPPLLDLPSALGA